MAVNLCGLLRSSLTLGIRGRSALAVFGVTVTTAPAGSTANTDTAIKMASNFIGFFMLHIYNAVDHFLVDTKFKIVYNKVWIII
jgi:hypothetical protein